jgi:WD40 repeat protein
MIRQWDLLSDPPGKELRSLEGHQGIVANLLLSSVSSHLLSSGDGTVRLWDRESGKELHRLEGLAGGLGFAPGKNTPLIAAGISRKALSLRDVTNGKEVQRFTPMMSDFENTSAYSPDGLCVASAERYGVVRLWKTTGATEAASYGHGGGPVLCMVFSEDGRRLAWGSNDGTVRSWLVETAKAKPPVLFSGLVKPVTSVAYSPDGTSLAAAATDGKVIVWDVATAKTRQEWKLPGAVHGVTFDAKSRYLALANANGTAFILRLEPLDQTTSGSETK